MYTNISSTPPQSKLKVNPTSLKPSLIYCLFQF